MERKYYEAYDDRYRQVHRENLQWFGDIPSNIVRNVIVRYTISGSILEIGCGEGRDAGDLLKQDFDLLATDISEQAVAFCRRRWPEYAHKFQVMNCIGGKLNARFEFIYAIAVLHMLVQQEDRTGFYQFIREHLTENGYALICTMGDGIMERSTDISEAFDLQERIHEQTGTRLFVAGTSYRAISFDTFEREIRENGLMTVEQGITNVEPDYGKMMYAVVKKS